MTFKLMITQLSGTVKQAICMLLWKKKTIADMVKLFHEDKHTKMLHIKQKNETA